MSTNILDNHLILGHTKIKQGFNISQVSSVSLVLPMLANLFILYFIKAVDALQTGMAPRYVQSALWGFVMVIKPLMDDLLRPFSEV